MGTLQTLKIKLRPAALRAGHVPRTALAERIAALGGGAWALLSAPAGYGKSTLAAEVAGASRVPVAWVAVDAGDDLRRFAAHVLAALGAASPCEETRLALDRDAEGDEDDLARALSNDLADVERDVLLVVDDLHAARDPAVERVVLDLAEHAPAGLRLLVTTRSEPARPLHRMRATGALVALRSADLAFDAAAIAQIVASRIGRAPEPADVVRIHEATRGWPFAVHLVATSLARNVDLGRCLARLAGHADLLGVLADEVLDTFEPALRRSVLALAPLAVLSAPLCEAVIPGADGAALLRELDRANAFVAAIDEARVEYVAHPLWSAFLAERAARELGPGALDETLRRASAHCEAKGQLGPAIEHALAASDCERAAALLERAAPRLLADGTGASVLRWLDALGDLGNRKALLAARAWATLLALRWRDAQAAAEELQRGLDAEVDGALLGQAAAVQAVVALAAGDAERGHRFAAEALERLPRGDAARAAVHGDRGVARARAGDLTGARADLAEAAAAGDTAIARGAAWHLAELDLVAGDARAARRAHRIAAERDRDPGHPSLAALAELAREADQLDEARARIDAYLDDARARGDAYALATGLIGRARVAASEGRFDVAREHLIEAGDLVDRTRLQPWIAGVRALGALVSLRAFVAGEPAAWADAEIALEQAAAAGLDAPAYLVTSNLPPEIVGLVAARRELVAGRIGPAVEALPAWRARAEAQARRRSVLEIDVVSALALAAAGDAAAAGAWTAARARAAAAGFVRLGLDDTALAERLLAPGAPPAPMLAARSQGASPLSRRETEVLELVATGLSTAAAARRLHVSHATVKKHLENIYGRLQVGSRMQAVAAARRLGLLP